VLDSQTQEYKQISPHNTYPYPTHVLAVILADYKCERAVCTELMNKLSEIDGYESPVRASRAGGAIRWLTGERIKYALGTSLYRLKHSKLKTTSSTKKAFIELQKYLLSEATKADAKPSKPEEAKDDPALMALVKTMYETLRTEPSDQIEHVPIPFDLTPPPQPKVKKTKPPTPPPPPTPIPTAPPEYDARIIASVAQLKASIGSNKWAERNKFWCQLILPQCTP